MVENITDSCRKTRLRWFGNVKRLCRKTNTVDSITTEKRKRKTKPEIEGLCQLRHKSSAIRVTGDEVHDKLNLEWLEEEEEYCLMWTFFLL